MTNRRRAPARRAARTSRLVWQPAEVQKDLTSTGIQITDLLLATGTLKHDATVERIRASFSLSGTRTLATIASFEISCGIWVGGENNTIATVPDPESSADDPAWLWVFHILTKHQGDGTLVTAAGLLNFWKEVDIKAKRRFRENFMTLWFIVNVDNAGLSDSATLIFKARTLLRVP